MAAQTGINRSKKAVTPSKGATALNNRYWVELWANSVSVILLYLPIQLFVPLPFPGMDYKGDGDNTIADKHTQVPADISWLPVLVPACFMIINIRWNRAVPRIALGMEALLSETPPTSS